MRIRWLCDTMTVRRSATNVTKGKRIIVITEDTHLAARG